ncbi:glycosyltransferase family 4 protein [Niallia taxi]|uniref:Glycosyltransferase family 1 protein n=1 Tax=Niallia taxi TaxID=2499688 RepID=A0A3S3SL46_9BACI|nr:glycosyltransferase family 4 protein [Niallia taxi]RVT63845.1 glycosyltransferase family 1 protein [Niallia taxi]
MKKKTIVFICEALGGGVRKHLLDLLENLDQSKFNITVIHGTKRMDTVFTNRIINMDNIKFYPIESMEREINPIKDLVSFIRVFNLLKLIKPDIVHCHSTKAGVLGRFTAKMLKVKCIVYTPHGYIVQNPNINKVKDLIFTNIERVLARGFTSRIIHVSKGEEEFSISKNICKRKKSKVIYNGISIIQEDEKYTAEKIFKIVSIARLDYQKNPMESIKIIEELINEFPNIRYTYIGDGEYYNEVVNYVNNNKLSDVIKLPGFSDSPSMFLRDADLFLSSSLYEGLPYSLIEAMAFKLPIVCSKVTGHTELVVDDFNGNLYELHNLDVAIRKIRDIINNPEKQKKMSTNSYCHYTNNFTINKMIKEHEELYLEV